MGCPSYVYIGNDLKFSITTHDPDTGILTDADSAPAYRVYEDETAVAILTGSMAKLDDGNTTGFYTEIISCTAVNGFEANKTYTVYIEATVDSDKGGICFEFIAYPEIVGAIWSKALEGAHTAADLLRVILAVVVNEASGGGTTTITYRDIADGKNRAVLTVDASGNRSVSIIDGTV